ncbi:PQQ-dependent sugar dehydrogenase [Thalassoroseus pseudoceratinae]|uniref:PQQ-dependent sugar dehydrogenase n=1 Tax=Thalassoroseus pseudoceratinae TaxID=2713176 RepID=UPI0014207CBF|nr:PQQ-dependent sugar dehydrogenase [Thalassoroseus pseudoceratinae]
MNSTLCRRRFVGFIVIILVLISSRQAFAEVPDVFAFSVDEYQPVTTSTVQGSPEPPLPFTVERAYPGWKVVRPVFVTTQPGTRRLVYLDQPENTQKSRLCRTLADPSESTETEVLVDLESLAYDVAFHPEFRKNGYLYVGHNRKKDDDEKYTCITRYTMQTESPYKLDAESAVEIISWKSNGHNGAAVAFGTDGMLFVTSGDGTSDSDGDLVGQRMDLLLAKVLRIDVDHPANGKMYSVPKDNPFVGQPGVAPETWAYGLRNPWRIAVDSKLGHVWVAQNGQDLWEQVYLVNPGDNYGWSVYEGSHPFYLNRELGPTPHVKPIFEHHHTVARSLTGGEVLWSRQFPELDGVYTYGDYSTGRVWAARVDADGQVKWHREIADTSLQITGFGIDPDGELLICDHQPDGGFYRLKRTPMQSAPSQFPRKLSESGLFASVKEHRLLPGAIPYSVNAPLWSDGAFKARWIVIPASDEKSASKIKLANYKGWDFPEETVIVKSFALESEKGNPASRKWIETRFLTKQQGEWAGYSYRWNDEQTDAMLVSDAGADDVFSVKTTDGIREQKWHFPSRTECMVCHSRAAGFTLGLSTGQMDKSHDYGSIQENQLTVLEQLGLVNKPVKKPKFQSLVDPHDKSADLTRRVKSYLHANCAQCHVRAGGGNSQIELSFGTPLEKMNIVDVKPMHHKFDLPEPRLVAPGEPERSVLLHRMKIRGPGQMPQLATFHQDEQAVKLLTEWIQSLPQPEKSE